MAPQHAKLAAYERELIGLVKAVWHWRLYLWARPFVVRTNHYSLKFLLDQRLSTILQHTWVSKLFGYDFSVEFNLGKNNTVVGALSQHDEEMLSAQRLSSPAFEFYDEFRWEAQSLSEIVEVKEDIVAGTTSTAWSIVDDLVLHDGRVFVSSSSALWPQILATAHGAGHEGVQKTLHRLWASFFNPHATCLVREFIQGCAVCQCNKTEHLHPPACSSPYKSPTPCGRTS